mgnify:CR=1 FL=1
MQRLHQGALAGFVGPAQQGEPRVERHRQFAVQAHMAQLGVEQTHVWLALGLQHGPVQGGERLLQRLLLISFGAS